MKNDLAAQTAKLVELKELEYKRFGEEKKQWAEEKAKADRMAEQARQWALEDQKKKE